MKKNLRKIAVLTSGGDAPGMNAAIRAVTRAAIYNKLKVVGVSYGYRGLINKDFAPLTSYGVSNILQLGGTILKTARSLEFETKKWRAQAYQNLLDEKIDALITIGGDGTFRGALALGDDFDFPVVGIPGTIDNDIYGTEYTIGYDTAMNTVITAVDKIKDTADSHERLFFIEVMGNEATDLAIACGVATGAEVIVLPNADHASDKLLNYLSEKYHQKRTSGIIMVAESKSSNAYELAEMVSKDFPQYESRVSVLGHMQRGGSPTAVDRINASRLGVAAIDALLHHQRNIMVGLKNSKVIHVPLSKAIKVHGEIKDQLLQLEDILSTN